MVDNSQGHSAYAEDALISTCMNAKPARKQACLQDGWFMSNGIKTTQSMNFPPNHPIFPDQPKGLKQVLSEHGFDVLRLRGKCKNSCQDPEAERCCCKRLLSLQPDFKAQKSLIQEVIEDAGHLSIFLPKFHCELNFIEFFWGMVKKYLHENCDFTYDTLKENMPKGLRSVPVATIRRWEHRMIRWMAAYRDGMAT